MVRNDERDANSSRDLNKFLRFQLSALLATAVDFLFTFLLKEELHVYYTWAVAGGAIAGATTAFTANRYWVFKSLQRHMVDQGFRYFIVASGSIVLNTACTYFFTEAFYMQYLVSKAIAALIIGFTYSYYFSKRFVFHV
jgi:putative flippase GtrA